MDGVNCSQNRKIMMTADACDVTGVQMISRSDNIAGSIAASLNPYGSMPSFLPSRCHQPSNEFSSEVLARDCAPQTCVRQERDNAPAPYLPLNFPPRHLTSSHLILHFLRSNAASMARIKKEPREPTRRSERVQIAEAVEKSKLEVNDMVSDLITISLT